VKIRHAFLSLVALLSAEHGWTNDPETYCGSRSQGIAGVRVMLADHWSGQGNPAGMAIITQPSFSICYENWFLIPDIGLGAFALNMPTKTGTFGMGFTTFGYSFYRENRAYLSFGRNLGQKVRAGIGLHYQTVRQSSDYGNLSALVPALGIQILPVQSLTIGFQLFNPAGQHYVPAGFLHLPVVFQTGFGWKLGDEVLICAEAEKRSQGKTTYRGGIEINWQQLLVFRFGIRSGEFPGYSFGVGLHYRSFMVDIAATHHPVLGFNPSVTISFN
jgi:hypothetical protein